MTVIPRHPTASRRSPARRRTGGAWVPRQHGAWAMIAVPFLVGTVLRARDGSPGWPLPTALAITWLMGYFAFNAASLWLKAAPVKRPAVAPALLTYAASTAAAGLVALLLAGPTLLGWLPLFAPLLGVGLWLAWRRRERDILGGAATVLAASLMLLVARFDSPGALLDGPNSRVPIQAAAVTFAYFFGTVVYVKTMIRERGRPAWLVASAAYHGGLAVVAATLALLDPWWWGISAFFAATTARSVLLPAIARRRSVRPGVVGILELFFSVALISLLLT